MVRTLSACVCALALLSPARVWGEDTKAENKPDPPLPRGALALNLTLGAGTTSWRGDVTGYGGLSFGLRLFGIVTPFAEGRVGYGRVDQRMLTFLSLGVEGGYPVTRKIYPRARIGFVHQHEESMASVAEEPGGTLFGIGKGIRHRAGVRFDAGCDFTLLERDKLRLTAGPEVTGAYLTYSSGPSLYLIIGGNLGLQAALF